MKKYFEFVEILFPDVFACELLLLQLRNYVLRRNSRGNGMMSNFVTFLRVT